MKIFCAVSKWHSYEVIRYIIFSLDDSWRCRHQRECWPSPHGLAADVRSHLLTEAVTASNAWILSAMLSQSDELISQHSLCIGWFFFLLKTKSFRPKVCDYYLLWGTENTTDKMRINSNFINIYWWRICYTYKQNLHFLSAFFSFTHNRHTKLIVELHCNYNHWSSADTGCWSAFLSSRSLGDWSGEGLHATSFLLRSGKKPPLWDDLITGKEGMVIRRNRRLEETVRVKHWLIQCVGRLPVPLCLETGNTTSPSATSSEEKMLEQPRLTLIFLWCEDPSC